jgi:MFS family permease
VHDGTVTSLREVAVAAYGPTALASIGTGAVLPVFALTARDLGAGVGLAALVVGLLGLGQLAADLPAGALAVRIGERPALMLACGLEVVGMLGCALAPTVVALSAAVVGLGVAGAVFGLARQAYLTDAVPIALRARALSTLGGVHRVGLFIGPFVGAVVVARWGTQSAYAVGVAASSLALVLLLVTPDPTASPAPTSTFPAPTRGAAAGKVNLGGTRATVARPATVLSVLGEHRRVLTTLGVGVLFVAAARAVRTALVPLWAQSIGLDAATTSLVFGISGAVDMLLFYPAGWVMDRHGRALVAVPSMLVLGVGLALLPLAGSVVTLTGVAVLLGAGNGIGSGIIMTLGADVSPVAERAQFLGGWRLMADAGNALGPAGLSVVAACAPLGVAALAAGALALVGAAWLAVWVPRYDPVGRSGRHTDRAGPSAPA